MCQSKQLIAQQKLNAIACALSNPYTLGCTGASEVQGRFCSLCRAVSEMTWSVLMIKLRTQGLRMQWADYSGYSFLYIT